MLRRRSNYNWWSAPPTRHRHRQWIAWPGCRSARSARSGFRRHPASFFPCSRARVYYVVTQRTNRIPSITDSLPARALEFDVTPLAAASSELAQDRVAQALVAGSPDARVYRLSSKRSPPLDGTAQAGLRLLLDGQRYISDLPPPPPQQLMTLQVLNSAPLDALYRIIRL
jgi:hypothetical protein